MNAHLFFWEESFSRFSKVYVDQWLLRAGGRDEEWLPVDVGFFLGWWECSKIVMMLHNSVNVLKWIVHFKWVNYISIKLLFKKVYVNKKDDKSGRAPGDKGTGAPELISIPSKASCALWPTRLHMESWPGGRNCINSGGNTVSWGLVKAIRAKVQSLRN